ncbi:DNA primase [Erythrobacteraceae bacterium CFH 75059]|uniref:DNA primase n=1 Tax=Qipengyuania thermophila TaxID=2509361 RepID=UPI0010206B63|nr:DNA primase [Qipengyuania thermophila]TCD05129.1 DNA primase [Erythrobacteraceae bacterium CFH 75059]
MTLSPQWLDELRARITLSAVIGRSVRLQKAGREYRACCPFHQEKTPSFYVNDAKGFYHCFGCQAHGDVIRWLTDHQGLGFMDAVRELAAQAGMDVPQPDPAAARRQDERSLLREALAAAQDWFTAQLGGPQGEGARAYLRSRMVPAEVLRGFGFGYAPAARGQLVAALGHLGTERLVTAGLLSVTEDGQAVERFRDRITLPIRDARGRVVGFGGRLISDRPNAPKYLNSPDTPLFSKGTMLFNLDRAAPAARTKGRLIVVEGYMDVVALSAAGLDEAVAALGTALTGEQLALLWHHADCPLLCFDGDAAGRRAALKAAERALPLLQPGKSLRIVSLPPGADPDDLVRAGGAKAVESLLDRASSLVEFLWHAERDAAPVQSPEEKAALKARLLRHVEAIGNRDIAALYRRELMDRFSAFAFPPRQVTGRGHATRGRAGSAGSAVPQQASAALRARQSGGDGHRLAAAVLLGLARHPDAIGCCADLLARLAGLHPCLASATDILLDHAEHPGDGASLAAAVRAALPAGSADAMPIASERDPQQAADALREAVTLLVERPALERALAEATARFATDPEGAFAEQQRLRKRKLEFDTRLRHIAGKPAPRVGQT